MQSARGTPGSIAPSPPEHRGGDGVVDIGLGALRQSRRPLPPQCAKHERPESRSPKICARCEDYREHGTSCSSWFFLRCRKRTTTARRTRRTSSDRFSSASLWTSVSSVVANARAAGGGVEGHVESSILNPLAQWVWRGWVRRLRFRLGPSLARRVSVSLPSFRGCDVRNIRFA